MRISGINIPENKRIEIGLSYLYGIGRKNAKSMLAAAGVDGAKNLKMSHQKRRMHFVVKLKK
jgi:small subunit ribosomal protein S13